MGAIASKFRKKKTTYEVLESIETEIKSIEEFQRNTELIRKRIVGRFVMLAVALYVITAFLFYFYCFPANIYDRLFYIIPLLFAPVLILLVKQTLTWYYQRKISRKQNKVVNLRNEKKAILEKVMDTETYKVAKSILDKFAPPEPIRKLPEAGTPARHVKPPVPSTAVNAGLRQRAISPKPQVLPTPIRPIPVSQPLTAVTTRAPSGQAPPMLPMPRTILPRERSTFDRMVDYLVGDGPSNRYALICNNCYGHNGMAYRDEAEYMSFRCCYCYTFNPAVKKRPVAPKFEYVLQSAPESDSDSEKNSPPDSSDSDDGVVVIKSAQEVEDSSESKGEGVEEKVVEEDHAKDQTVHENIEKVGTTDENTEKVANTDSETKD
ncbi:hypothetical protein PPYR_00833 [Photinus pyralis]|uniref:Endoplasmic reticulum junction formation protein lunapark n=1 Tax=Photinus pyralis TaxID=7054 RepID=A0A1Y1MZT0_PHOPY|nr:endoplasmic reticulum junction formation protein lunapark-B [Photinus pyralis]KAB0803863.1 hypothetical protein PPYR_00833 [Photinus pyralis]